MKKTALATGVSTASIYIIRERGATEPTSRKNNRIAFSKIDSFSKDLIQRTVYAFYDQKIAPTLDMIYDKLKD